MAGKKKARNRQKRTKGAPRKKSASTKKAATKKLAGKRASQIKAAVKKAVSGRIRGTLTVPKKHRRRRSRSETAVALSPEEQELRSGGQAGDLQGLSSLDVADSESVQELLEEGNAFEADVVTGVEDAGKPREVRTHEVPEDDVPGEYLDTE